MKQMNIALEMLVVSKFNARKDLQAGQEDSGIDELASSIRHQGLLSPPIVRQIANCRYEILVGQRRLMACRKIGLNPVPCLVRHDLSDADAVTLSLVEYVHRADMNPLDKAHALRALYDRHLSFEQVSKETSWSVPTVKKYVRLLSLPPELQAHLNSVGGTAGVGTMARLAATFSGRHAIDVFNKVSGFTQRIQEEIIKRSGGDLQAVDNLVGEAQEGAFNVRRCGGIFGCGIIRDIFLHGLSQSEFEEIVSRAAEDKAAEFPEARLREAANAFWQALAAYD
jgi:ParB/RepB/Spo0J family partition protein